MVAATAGSTGSEGIAVVVVVGLAVVNAEALTVADSLAADSLVAGWVVADSLA